MSTARSLRLLAAAALTLAGGCTSAYLQNEGPYEFSLREVLRDDCSLLPPDGRLWNGSLRIAGDVAYMSYELLDMQLIGFFLEGGEEGFYLDGSASGAAVVARGNECVVDQASVHLEALTRCPSQFEGILRVRYEAARDPVCACELWATFQAVQGASPCAGTP